MRYSVSKPWLHFALMILCGCALAACSDAPPQGNQNDTAQEKIAEALKPVTIRFYVNALAYFSEVDFNAAVVQPVKKKYPHITIEPVIKGLVPALTAGETVDLYIEWHGPMGKYKELDYFMDLTPLIKKHNYDLGRISPGALDAMRMLSNNGNELYALPYTDMIYGLFYNKDIFDKFGVPYPKDGMTWDETIELATKLTRQDSGVQYYGLGTETHNRLLFPLSSAYIDAKTERSEVNDNPIYRQGFDMFKKLYNMQQRTTLFTDNHFIKDKIVAMFATRNILATLRTSDLNWDVAQYPSYPNRPNTFGMHDLHVMMPNKHTKHPDDVMRVMEVVLSDESQQYLASTVGRAAILKDPKFQSMLGSSHPELRNKNITGIFKSKNAPGVNFSQYYNIAESVVNTTRMTELIQNKVDANTMLRQADEEINKRISELKK